VSADLGQTEKSSLPAQAESKPEVNRKDQGVGDQASAFRVSKNLGIAQTRRNEDQPEESLPVVETREIEFAEEKIAQTASETGSRDITES
jgi:hypothetical protein